MKQLKCLLAALLAVLMLVGCVTTPNPTQPTSPSQPTQPEDKGSIKILSIGNSFSRDSQQHLWNIFTDGGYSDVKLGIAYIGGSSLDLHWSHMQTGEAAYEYHQNSVGAWVQEPGNKILDILKSQDWDIITLQQQSVQAGQENSFGNLQNILDWLDENKTNPDAKIYWNMTWAYEDGCTASNAQAYYNCEQSKMYEAIVTTTPKVITDSRFAGIIPTGTAIQNLRSSYIGENVCRDGYHLNDTYGRYTAALTLYAMFTGSDLSEITWVPDNRLYLMKDFGAIHESVLDALANPYAISEITAEKESTGSDNVASGELIAEWNFDGETTADSKGKFNAVLFDDTREVAGNYVSGISGKALQLSDKGKGDKLWLSIPYDAFGKHQDSFTLSLWYKATDHNTSGENSELFSLYNSSKEKFLFYGVMHDGGTNGFTMKWNGQYGYANVIGGYQENTWMHLVYCVENREGQSVITAYVNGKKVEVDQGGDWTGGLMSELGIDTFTIGGKNPYKGGPTPKCLFYGAVDEVRLYAGALTHADALAIYEQNTQLWFDKEDATGYDYSFALVGDTQILSRDYPDKLSNIYDWLVNNAAGKKMQFVFGLGDITDKDTDAEWNAAMPQIHKLDGVVPYSLIRGNHDGIGQFDKYVPLSDYQDKITASMDGTMRNTYQRFTAGGLKYLVLNLDIGPSDAVLAWANDVVAAHPDYNVIVTTHAYLTYDGSHLSEESIGSHVAPTVWGYENNGDDIWNKLVKKHANIVMVLCGHIDVSVNQVVQLQGDHGNTVTQILVNPQGLDAGYYPTGMVAMLYFSNGGKTVNMEYYSTVKGQYLHKENLKTLTVNVIANTGAPDPDPVVPTDPKPTEPKPTEPSDEPETGDLLAEINFNDGTTGIGTLYDNKNKVSGTFVDGVSGKALQLSTKGGAQKLWLSVPYDVFDGSRDSFTISLWYKATGYNTSGEDSQLFSLYNSKSEKFLFYSYAAKAFQDKAFTMKWDSTYGYANVMTPYAENEWVHLVFCVEAQGNTSRISAYVNGKKVEVDQGGEWSNSLMSQFGVDTFTIGGKNPYKGGATPACLFYGQVDEIRVYAGALNADQAAELYNAVK